MQDWHSHSGETDTNASDHPRHGHLSIGVGSCLDGGADDDNEVRKNERALSAELFTKDEGGDGAEGTSNIVNASDETLKCGRGVTEPG